LSPFLHVLQQEVKFGGKSSIELCQSIEHLCLVDIRVGLDALLEVGLGVGHGECTHQRDEKCEHYENAREISHGCRSMGRAERYKKSAMSEESR
jgi:hypothetical protein